MVLNTENVLLFGSIMLFISILASKTSYRMGVPVLILFMVVGMLAGSEGPGGIYFDDPKIAQFLGVVALNFILFSGGLDTKWESVRPIVRQGILLSTAGVLITAMAVGVFVHFLTGLSLAEGMLLGSIVSATDAAAVFSILRTKSIGLKRNIRPLLELESGSNDPMAYFLTLSFIFLIQEGNEGIGHLILFFFKGMLLGGLCGWLMGRLMVKIVNSLKLDAEGLYPVLILSLIFFTFSFTDFIGGNGFLAIYLSAVILGNSNFIHKKSLMRFYDGQAWLMQIIMFLTLGLLVYPSHIIPVLVPGLAISLFLIFGARPLAVFLCLALFKVRLKDKFFISWVGLRGAVPIVFATYPMIEGLEKADLIFNLVFFISASSVILQGSTLTYFAQKLRLIVPAQVRKTYPLEMEVIDRDKQEMEEVMVPPGSLVAGRALVEVNFPKTVYVVMVYRDDHYFMPKGSTVIEAGDELTILADNTQTLELINEALKLVRIN